MTTESRTILITGASSGIGRATAEALLADGHRVVGIARNFSGRAIDSPRFTPVSIDLGDIKALPERLETVVAQQPQVDAIIHCAGQGRFGSLEEFGYKQIYKFMDLNFTSHAFVCRAFMPLLRRRSHSNIIFIGSEAALRGAQKGSLYCAAKFALRGFAQALREECSGSGVHVSIINPGMVKSGFFDALDFSHGEEHCNYIEVGDVAAAIRMIIDGRPGTVIDEINLSPLKKVVRAKKRLE